MIKTVTETVQGRCVKTNRQGLQMHKAKTAIVMLTLFITTAAYPQAAATAPRSADTELFRFVFNKQPLTPQTRAELSRRFEAYCREFLGKVPTNTPAEDKWITTELSALDDVNRSSRLVSSQEWARHQLQEVFSECLQKVALLQQAQANGARSAEAVRGDNQDERAASIRMRMRRGWADGGRA